ncbi:Fic family protein [Desulfonatronum sp. SC1]|uniref:Fic family protein n=1 Tax=Desulfonatronum sp. SC1 TaxID=2109626 RepID=UPI000D31C916|nr:Fic family protein [Desulfonatronum sp. SC1]PTN31765.1 cell filamentation protein Fic [Desulfonatronum sp. SC1]
MHKDIQRAIFIAKKLFAELVYDVQALEGMPFTMPEVQTYLQGITVGGHKVADEEKLKQQALGWKRLISLVEEDAFQVSKPVACVLQSIIAKDEALEVGQFRSGRVGISGTDYQPPDPESLDDYFQTMIQSLDQYTDLRDQAYVLHLLFARNQFFFDGNKRTGLLMMNGLLLSKARPPLSIPAKRLHEYNVGMIRYFDTGDPSEMLAFLRQCHDRMHERFGL